MADEMGDGTPRPAVWTVFRLGEAFMEQATVERAEAREFKPRPLRQPLYVEMRLPDGRSITAAVELKDWETLKLDVRPVE